MRGDEVRQAIARLVVGLRALLTQHREARQLQRARSVREQHDVVAVGVGRPEPVDPPRLQQLLVGDAVEQFGGIGIELARGLAVLGVVEHSGEPSAQLPRVEEERPVDIRHQVRQRDVIQDSCTRELGDGDVIGAPRDRRALGPCVGELEHGARRLAGMHLAKLVLLGAQIDQEIVAGILVDDTRHDIDGLGRIEDVGNQARIFRGDLDRGVLFARGRPTDQQRQLEVASLHLTRHMDHLVKRRRDEAGQPDDVGVLGNRGIQDPVGGDHDAQVDDLVPVAAQHHAHDVLADVMHVALDGGDHHLSLRRGAGALAILLHIRLQDRDRAFHDTCALDDLRQEHLALTEALTHDPDPSHQRTFDHRERGGVDQTGLLGVGLDVVDDAVDQRVRESLLKRALTPRGVDDLARNAVALDRLGKCDQPLGRVVAPVVDDVLDQLQQFGRDVLVDAKLPGVDDAHVQAGVDGVVQECRVHGFAHDVVAAERERQVADAAAGADPRTALLDLAHRRDEAASVVGVLLEPGRDGQYVGVDDDVLGRHPGPIHKQSVGALGDRDAAFGGIGLAGLVEAHDNAAGAVAAQRAGLVEEVLLALLEADGVGDRLALHALEPGLDDRPLAGVDHDRDAGDLGLGCDHVEKRRHGLLGVEHALVHVDVDDVGAVAHLVGCDLECGGVVAVQDELGKAA